MHRPDHNSKTTDSQLGDSQRISHPSPGDFSVIIPTLNEQERVGSVVREAFDAGAFAVFVADSASTDSTALNASNAGATVVQVQDLAPGTKPLGKGDAIWRTLGLVETDLVVFLDGDLDIDGPAFLRPLLAPLESSTVKLSKASFSRITASGTIESGRVTEETARPLLVNYYPELADLREPLSGQVAAHMDLFTSIGMEVDYGLEIGMLIDTYKMFGPSAIAHPDCGLLSHISQPKVRLDGMSVQVTRAVMDRVNKTSSSLMRPPRSELLVHDEARPVVQDPQALRSPDQRER